eukprot:9201785-Pyramimonas_sp.AAC.1
MKTPSEHLAMKVDECGVATEADGSTAVTITTNLLCQEMPVPIKETTDATPKASATPSMRKRFHTRSNRWWTTPSRRWRRNTLYSDKPTPADQDFGARDLQAK